MMDVDVFAAMIAMAIGGGLVAIVIERDKQDKLRVVALGVAIGFTAYLMLASAFPVLAPPSCRAGDANRRFVTIGLSGVLVWLAVYFFRRAHSQR
jgi:cytochrome bd-type quinol oxidase subunit 2